MNDVFEEFLSKRIEPLADDGSVKVRQMRENEWLTPALTDTIFGKLDPNWVWLAISNFEPVASLVLAPMHDLVMFVRALATDDAPQSAILKLIRVASREAIARGYERGIVMIEHGTPAAEKLREIAAHGCDKQRQAAMTFMLGSLRKFTGGHADA